MNLIDVIRHVVTKYTARVAIPLAFLNPFLWYGNIGVSSSMRTMIFVMIGGSFFFLVCWSIAAYEADKEKEEIKRRKMSQSAR